MRTAFGFMMYAQNKDAAQEKGRNGRQEHEKKTGKY